MKSALSEFFPIIFFKLKLMKSFLFPFLYTSGGKFGFMLCDEAMNSYCVRIILPPNLRLSGYYKEGFPDADADSFQRVAKDMDNHMEIVFSSEGKGLDVKIERSEKGRKCQREEEKKDVTEGKRRKRERDEGSNGIGEKSNKTEDEDKENEGENNVSQGKVNDLSDHEPC